MAVEKTVNHNSVGLCTTFEEVHITIFFINRAGAEYKAFRFCSKFIVAIAHCVEHVGISEAFEHIGMSAGHVIAVKIYHGLFSNLVILTAKVA